MSWGEVYRLTQQLVTDPGSHLGAALAGWDYPLSRESIAAMDLYDLTHQIAWAQADKKKRGPKPKPYPRPWPDRTKTRPKPTVSQSEVLAALRRAGHSGPLPKWARTSAA